ncbi:carbohydrate esterase family 5 protein [Hypoxylon trugodes]|uniref:carbohydrate esterase family 5 protein n=1 Tax=Hypoxylon trugodes TaxID=326681 RepID=UPI00219C183E|nr:carbohydrate esterase family 5 protein [Hypoxylon trugodes]KAI1383408.1 carbohydrate esterase family 5 protein [Hypoxylon trugodes]
MRLNTIILSAVATASSINTRQQNCPEIHIFGARETTALPGFGSASTVVNLVQQANKGATSESIIYPAAGGNVYSASVTAGVTAVANQTNTFNKMCPGSKIIMVGYSQGAQIVDDAFCGGPDRVSLNTTKASISSGVSKMVAAIILMGNPRHVDGLPFNVGNATAGGFAARPAGFKCPAFENIIQAYCDAEDPFCAKGNKTATHQGYGREYGQAALQFVQSKLEGSNENVSNGTNVITTSTAPSPGFHGGYIWTVLALVAIFHL